MLDKMAFNKETLRVNRFIAKAKEVHRLMYDAEITLTLNDALKQVETSSYSYYKYKDMEPLTEDLPLKAEKRGAATAFLNVASIHALRTWHFYRVAGMQATPSRKEFTSKMMELRSAQTDSIDGILKEPCDKTVDRYIRMISGFTGSVTVRTKSRTKALLNLTHAISLGATLTYGFSKVIILRHPYVETCDLSRSATFLFVDFGGIVYHD